MEAMNHTVSREGAVRELASEDPLYCQHLSILATTKNNRVEVLGRPNQTVNMQFNKVNSSDFIKRYADVFRVKFFHKKNKNISMYFNATETNLCDTRHRCETRNTLDMQTFP